MSLHVSYMGTKRLLSPTICNLISMAEPGPVLDLFSGVSTIGSELSIDRQIWCNDTQLFSHSASRALFQSQSLPIPVDMAIDLVQPYFLENREHLERLYSDQYSLEKMTLSKAVLSQLKKLEAKMPHTGYSPALNDVRKSYSREPNKFPYCLFSISYSGSYFGLLQCIFIDSIRYAIDQLTIRKDIDSDERLWLLIALAKTMNKISTSTGHFAQYMSINEKNQRRFLNQRKKSVWREWIKSMYELAPIGSRYWRQNNRSYNQDAISLLENLKKTGESPAIIYADPPYTGDQYSRYYHLYETLIKYDYPESSGTGRYRSDRYQSSFSLSREVESAVEQLIQKSAEICSSLILSYPESGILKDSRKKIISWIKYYYNTECSILEVKHSHSSLGGSKGSESNAVIELVYFV